MGRAAVQLDESRDEADTGTVIQLKPQTAPQPRPALVSANAPRTDLASVLGMVSRTATLLASRKDRADQMEKRSIHVEENLRAARDRIAELESRLRAALEEVEAGKAGLADLQKRSADLVERSKAMLAEASTRLKAAETRAERAEAGYTMIRDAVEQQLSSHLRM